MEAILQNQLKRRDSLLQEAIVRAEKFILECYTGAPEMELFKTKLEIKQELENITKAINFYISQTKEPSAELVESCMENQVKGEKMQRDLEAISHLVQATSKQTSTCKLPKLELLKFGGDILSFAEFWDRFKATVATQDISDAEKLAYLLNSVEGSARESLQGLNATNENYDIAVDILQNRYGSKALLIDAHYEALNKLKPAKSASECRGNLNNIEKHLRILESLGEDIYNNHLRVSITSKFPDNVQYQLNLLTPIDRDVKVLREGLNKIITALERAEMERPSSSSQVEEIKATTTSLHTKAVKRPRQEATRDNYQKKQRIECVFCKGAHFSDKCLKYKTMQDRKRQLKGKCFSCFRSGHSINDCKIKKKCYICKTFQHNTALCPEKLKSKYSKNARASTEKSQSAEKTSASDKSDYTLVELPVKNKEVVCSTSNSKSFLQTVVARIKNGNKEIPCRILIDCGSQRSYVTTRMVTKLQIKPKDEDQLVIYTFGSDIPQQLSSPSVDIVARTKRGVERIVRVNVVPHITTRVPVNDLKLNKYEAVDILADDDSLGDTIDMLIGNDYYFSFMRNDHIQIDENLFLLNTDFGWIISGNTASNIEDNMLNVVTYCQCHEAACPYFVEPDLPLRNIDMKFLWSLESIGISDSPKSTREEEAVKFFNETTIYENGRYLVKWPWIQYPPELPTNFGLAYGRLKHLIHRSNENTLEEYNEILQEQLSAKVIEVVDQQSIPMNQVNPPVHYLPHHIIQQEGKRGRIVYDASAKLKDNRSLNECLYRGPSMLEDLIGLLLKFRTNAIGINADVEKAFLQVGLQDEDKDVTRFLWLKDIKKGLSDDNLLHLRFCRVPFGIISSPFLLTATIRNHIARTNGNLMKDIADKCYMDNLLTGAPSLESAVQLFHNTQTVFKQLSMNIREWMSNNEEFMKMIPEALKSKHGEKCKVLGLMWDVKHDTIELKLSEEVFEEHNIEENKTKSPTDIS